MRRLLTLLAAGACLSLTAASAPQPTAPPAEQAQSEPVVGSPAPAPAEASAAEAAGEPTAVNTPGVETAAPMADLEAVPLAAEIAATKAAFQSKLAELTAAFQQAHDPEQALSLQRQIQQLKLDTEIGYLEIQARHARARGMDQLAAEAEEMIQAARATAERTPQSAAQAAPPATTDAGSPSNAQQQK